MDQLKYNSIDGLRAYAAIGIVIMHVQANISSSYTPCFINTLIGHFGWMFILLFMLISSFGLCCGYYNRLKNGEPGILEQFYKKRYIKIWPYFALLVLIDFAREPSFNSFCDTFANLTLAFGLLPNPKIEIIGVGWFLGVIFLFYMLFPFFVFLFSSAKRAIGALIVSIIFLYVSLTYFFTDAFIGDIRSAYNIVNYLPFFISGGIIYLYREKLLATRQSILYIRILTLFLTLCSLLLIKFGLFSYNVRLFYMIPLSSSWLLFAMTYFNKTNALNNTVVKFISSISMEIYLVHMVMFRIVEKLCLVNIIENWWLLYILECVLTLSLAMGFAVAYQKVGKLLLKRIEK